MDRVNSILVVDDDVGSLLELADILQPDYKVSTVKEGQEALDLLDNQLYDLILLDVIMPNMSGFDVLLKLKESQRTKDIPTIFITGAESGELEGLSIGAIDYIRKPFEHAVVKHRVDNQIKMQALNRELEYTAENATKLALVAQAANRTKSSFVAHISNELNSPLSHLIKTAENLLDNRTLQADVVDDLYRIITSGNLLKGFLNDLLDFSKLEAEMIALTPSQYNVAKMLGDVIRTNLPIITNKPVKFELDADENLPTILSGDEIRIKQILDNILSNAFKYTDSGFVKMSAKTESQGGEFFLVVKVEDTGCGMSGEQLDTLYNEYERFHMSSKSIEGIGLGMPIVKHLLALMHGDIFAQSNVSEGSVFTVRIPQRQIGTAVIGPKGKDKLQKICTKGSI